MIHGGDVYTEGILKGRKLLDFSSNINPIGVPKSFLDHMEEAIESLERYPDVKYRELLKTLSEYIGTDEKYFVLGNGAAEIIDLTISCFKNILLVVPSFAEYEISARKWECDIEYSYLKEDFQIDYEDVLKKLKYNEAVILGNPNNPNGSIIDKAKFAEILEFCEANNKVIIIDEAFIEFASMEKYSFIEYLSHPMVNYKSVFIIRALTKFFAMPGIRFGYGVSRNEELLYKIRKKQNPWNINCFAELAAKYVLKDVEYIEKSKQWIEKEREFFTNELNSVRFIQKVFKTHSNFVLCKLQGIKGEELYEKCMERSVVIRRAYNFKGLDESYIRLAIKDRTSNLLMMEVLKTIEKNML